MNWRIGFAAVASVAVLCAIVFHAARTGVDACFWYDDFPFTFSAPVTAVLGGPLTTSEIDAIKQISREELTRAFSGLKVTFTESRKARWTVGVQLALERRKGQRLPNAGETFAMGPLEYFSHNRPSQYYGELHWARAWPVLVERVGT